MKRVFSEKELNAVGKQTGFFKRERDITLYWLCLGLFEVMGLSKIESIAYMHRTINALCHTKVQYKPFHNQSAKMQFSKFMRTMCERVLVKLSGEALHFSDDSPFAQFKRIVLQDDTSFAVKSALNQYIPGRFT